MDKMFLTAQDVADYMGIAIPTAYKIIRRLNRELAEQGYIVIAGKVSRKYFETKVYADTVA